MYRAKVLIVGPAESGKTVIANVLSEATETSSGDYHPTRGVRILEFEVPDVSVIGTPIRAEIELWDCSGDHKYESCWPAMARDAGGVILVCNPEMGKEHDKQLQTWYSYYVEQQSMRESQCVVFAHSKSSDGDSRRINLSGSLGRLSMVKTSLEDDGDLLKNEFKNFLGGLFASISERREQEEMGILNSR